MRLARYLLIFVLFQSSILNLKAADTLRVGIAGSSPFVSDTMGDDGISIEIWEALAQKMKWEYQKVYFGDVPTALNALEKGVVDAVAGPVSITAERAAKVRFTQPYFQSSLSILSREDDPTLWERIAPFFTKKFFVAVIVFLLILGIVGALMWLAERKKNTEQFTDKPMTGILNGMWCAIVTMTTTGYGDIAPKTLWGRIIAATWMVISLIFATTLIAGIASTVTLTGMTTTVIKSSDELPGEKVAVINGAPAEDFARENRGKIVYVENLAQGVDFLMNKKANALVYDRPQLQYFLQQHPDVHAVLSVAEFERQGYGFAFPLDDTLVHIINVSLLELKESGQVKSIVENWLGKDKGK